MKAIYKRELASYFRSPLGWVAIALFAVIGGLYFSLYMSNTNTVDIREELGLIQGFFLVIIPLLTMRLFSEEKKNGTEVLLFTSTVPLFKIVLGKYLAALSLLLIMLTTVFLHMILIAAMGGLVNAASFGSLITFILIGALFISFGVMASAVTENQIIAAVFSAVMIIFTQLLQIIASLLEGVFVSIASIVNPLNISVESIYKAGENLANAINWLDPSSRTSSYSLGIFSISPLVFIFSLIVLYLFLTYRILEKRRWSQG